MVPTRGREKSAPYARCRQDEVRARPGRVINDLNASPSGSRDTRKDVLPRVLAVSATAIMSIRSSSRTANPRARIARRIRRSVAIVANRQHPAISRGVMVADSPGPLVNGPSASSTRASPRGRVEKTETEIMVTRPPERGEDRARNGLSGHLATWSRASRRASKAPRDPGVGYRPTQGNDLDSRSVTRTCGREPAGHEVKSPPRQGREGNEKQWSVRRRGDRKVRHRSVTRAGHPISRRAVARMSEARMSPDEARTRPAPPPPRARKVAVRQSAGLSWSPNRGIARSDDDGAGLPGTASWRVARALETRRRRRSGKALADDARSRKEMSVFAPVGTLKAMVRDERRRIRLSMSGIREPAAQG